MAIDRETLHQALGTTLLSTDLPNHGHKYAGKVRDNYVTGDGRRLIVVSDRISAFDRVLGTLPFKGQVLNRATAFWFEQTADLVPNHMLSVPDPNVMECVDCKPLAVEMVVRAYLTGVSSTSILTAYARGDREFCGHKLPDGLQPHRPLPQPILTPTTKAAHGDHDQNASREEIISQGQVTAAQFDEAAAYALRLFEAGQRHCASRGLILVDTKYEFGLHPDGHIVVIDEIHTPDSSRFWFEESYESRLNEGKAPESFDKEYVRRYLVDQGFKGDGPIPEIPDAVRVEAAARYIQACETVMGTAFAPDLEAPQTRIARNLAPLA